MCIYVVPKSETEKWVSYPWNVPYDESVRTLMLWQMGFEPKDGKSAFTRFNEVLSRFSRFTSYDQSTADTEHVIFCDEQMTASAKPESKTAGIMWKNTVKCTAIHPTPTDVRTMSELMREPHDLVLVSDNHDYFLLRTPAEGYHFEEVQNLGNSWRHDVTFTLQNCHGLQLINID